MNYDLISIGGGPAGVAAAIQAKRLGLSCAIIEKNAIGGQVRSARLIENYLGFPDGVSGRTLSELFVKQLSYWEVPTIFSEVTDITYANNGFFVRTKDKELRAAQVVVALGLSPARLGLPDEYLYASPDWVEHEGKRVLLVGGGDAAFDLACQYAIKAASVTILMRSSRPKALKRLIDAALEKGVKIVAEQPIETIPHDLLISCIGKEQRHPLLDRLTERFGRFELKTGECQSLPGLFLAGDLCHPDEKYVAIAAAEGIHCAEMAWRNINGN